MAAVFSIGAIFSISALIVGGAFDMRAAAFGFAGLPFLGSGFALSVLTRKAISGYWLRVGVLITAGIAGILLLIQALI